VPPQEGSAYEEIVEESDESEEELEELPPPVGPAALPQANGLSICLLRATASISTQTLRETHVQAPLDTNLNFGLVESALKAMTPASWSKVNVEVLTFVHALNALGASATEGVPINNPLSLYYRVCD
jgi:hypothetical protein